MPLVLTNAPGVEPAPHASNGARLVSLTGKILPLRQITLVCDATGGVARTKLRQHFRNEYRQPLELVYTFPLPADSAVSGYEIRAGERLMKGRIERRDDARAYYETARLDGRTAGLVDQERSNVFTQRLGNIPPLTDVTVELTIDQPLQWIAGHGWEWRFPTVVAPRYVGAEGIVPDAERVTVDVVNGVTPATASLTLTIADDLAGTPTSPTHPIVATNQSVTLAAGAALDRDIVIRWPCPRSSPGCDLRTTRAIDTETAGNTAFGLLTITPPTTQVRNLARDLVLLLDVSGSMSGKPLAHLKTVVTDLIDTLNDGDRLEMIAFSSEQIRYRQEPVRASATERSKAIAWIRNLHAGGGTELISAIHEALRPLRDDAPRQVVVVTDGQIGFETGAVRAIRDRLPRGSRLHMVGLGSAANRSFLRPAARAGRGVEVLIDLDEAATRGAERIVAATRGPVVSDVAIEGTALLSAAPLLPDLLSGSPVVAALQLRGEGGSLIVCGKTADGVWEQRLDVKPPVADAGLTAIQALWAREAIEDLELGLACGGNTADINAQIERIALRHSIASRLTSWVAIAQEQSVDPRDPVRVECIPQSLPYGMSAEGLGLIGVGAFGTVTLAGMSPAALLNMTDFGPSALDTGTDDAPPTLTGWQAGRPLPAPTRSGGWLFGWLFGWLGWLGRRTRQDEHLVELHVSGHAFATPVRPTTTIEFLATSDLLWRPAETATLDGRAVRVIEQGSTRGGAVAAGSFVRFEIAVSPDNTPRTGTIALRCGEILLIVEFEAR